MSNALAHHPVLLVFVILALGTVIGMIRIRSVALGPAAVLFAALAFSGYDERLATPEVLGTLGLAVFAYCVGITAGPSFFASLRRSIVPVVLVSVALVACAAVAWLVGVVAFNLDGATVAGIYAGALTNTPALAATVGATGGASEPTVGYSLAYIGGVLVMLGAALYALRSGQVHPTRSDKNKVSSVKNTTIRVQHHWLPPASELAETPHGRIVFSRYKHAGVVEVVRAETTFVPGDRVVAVGSEKALDHLTQQLGRTSTGPLHLERTEVDFRRITLSSKRLIGHTVAQLDLFERFGAHATRVRRADQDLLATDDLILQAGDRIRVAAPARQIPAISRFLGDSERGTSDINPLGLALGLSIGLAFGLLEVPMPGGQSLTIGHALGPLTVGLVLGRLQRTGPVRWSLAHSASEALSNLGLLLFLAYAGGRAGSAFVEALASPLGWKVIVTGLAVTAFSAITVTLICRGLVRNSGPWTAGAISGAQTQPAVLAYVMDRTEGDQRASLGYAVIYPAAMVVKIVVAQALVVLLF